MKLSKLGHWLRADIGKINRSRCPIFPSTWKQIYIKKKKKKPYPQRLMPVLSAHVRALEPGDKRSDGSGNWDRVHMVRNISGISSSSGKDVMLLWHYSALRRWIRCTQRRSHNALPGFWGHKSAAVLRTQSGFRLYARIYDWLITTPNSQIWML